MGDLFTPKFVAVFLVTFLALLISAIVMILVLHFSLLEWLWQIWLPILVLFIVNRFEILFFKWDLISDDESSIAIIAALVLTLLLVLLTKLGIYLMT